MVEIRTSSQAARQNSRYRLAREIIMNLRQIDQSAYVSHVQGRSADTQASAPEAHSLSGVTSMMSQNSRRGKPSTSALRQIEKL